MNKDKKIWDEEIRPSIKTIYELCRKHEIAMFAAFSFYDDPEEISLYSVSGYEKTPRILFLRKLHTIIVGWLAPYPAPPGSVHDG